MFTNITTQLYQHTSRTDVRRKSSQISAIYVDSEGIIVGLCIYYHPLPSSFPDVHVLCESKVGIRCVGCAG